MLTRMSQLPILRYSWSIPLPPPFSIQRHNKGDYAIDFVHYFLIMINRPLISHKYRSSPVAPLVGSTAFYASMLQELALSKVSVAAYMSIYWRIAVSMPFILTNFVCRNA
jgi:hypothetical protein